MSAINGYEILQPTVLLLGAGFLVIYFCRLIRISPIIGFLLAGLALGPHGLNMIEENAITHFLAELGVVFLLFDIGLHFSFKSGRSLRKDLLQLAPLQLFLSGLVLAFSTSIIYGISAHMALLVGFTLAISSTAVVMQVIGELRQTESPVGQSAKAMLIFQDLIAIFLLIFADTMGAEVSLFAAVLTTLGKTLLSFAAAIALGQYVLTPLMKSIIRYDDPEMFTILGLLIVMVTGLATASAGLSLTLGAFLAGMVLAETPFRVLLQSELRPFRSLLLALFFITIGMMLDPVAIWEKAPEILSLTIFLIAAKGAIIAALIFVMGRPVHHTLQLTFLMAQGSEFAFVIFSLVAAQGALGMGITEDLIAAVAISMLLTPALSTLAYRISLQVCNLLNGPISNDPGNEFSPKNRQPVFIVGMNEIGKTLARSMKAHDIPYIAVDHNRKRFLEATAAGYIVAYGQPEDLRFWNTLNVRSARALCIATPRYEVAQRLAPIIKRVYPSLKRYVAVQDSADGVRFAGLGMTPFHNHGTPPGLGMASFVLAELGIKEEDIARWSEDEQSAYLDSHKSSRADEFLTAAAE